MAEARGEVRKLAKTFTSTPRRHPEHCAVIPNEEDGFTSLVSERPSASLRRSRRELPLELIGWNWRPRWVGLHDRRQASEYTPSSAIELFRASSRRHAGGGGEPRHRLRAAGRALVAHRDKQGRLPGRAHRRRHHEDLAGRQAHFDGARRNCPWCHGARRPSMRRSPGRRAARSATRANLHRDQPRLRTQDLYEEFVQRLAPRRWPDRRRRARQGGRRRRSGRQPGI